MHIHPQKIMHVGASLHNDVGGAQAVGIWIIWMNRHHVRSEIAGQAKKDGNNDGAKQARQLSIVLVGIRTILRHNHLMKLSVCRLRRRGR